MEAPAKEQLTASDSEMAIDSDALPVETTRSKLSLGGMSVIALVLLLLLVVGLGLVRTQAGPVAVGSQAPDFTLSTFDGDEISRQSLAGQVIVVNFWASWCLPCEDEAAELEAAWRNYRNRGVMFLGVNYVDTESEAMEYLGRFEISYPNGPDLGTRIAQAFRIRGVPETFVIDGTGEIVSVMKGPYASQAQIERAIEQALDS